MGRFQKCDGSGDTDAGGSEKGDGPIAATFFGDVPEDVAHKQGVVLGPGGAFCF